MSPGQSSRLWQPDGGWWGWVPAGARSGSGGSLWQFYKTRGLQPPGAQRAGVQAGCGRARPKPFPSPGWSDFGVSALACSRLMARLSWKDSSER